MSILRISTIFINSKNKRSLIKQTFLRDFCMKRVSPRKRSYLYDTYEPEITILGQAYALPVPLTSPGLKLFPWSWDEFWTCLCCWAATGALLSTCMVSLRRSYRGRGLLVGCLSLYQYWGLWMTFPSINRSPGGRWENKQRSEKKLSNKKYNGRLKLKRASSWTRVVASDIAYLHNLCLAHQDMNLARPRELPVILKIMKS